MNKLKGSLSAVKMKYLIFVFAAAVLAALPTRVYQLLALVDPTNGYYNGDDVTIPVLYGAVFIFTIIFIALSFLSKEVPSPKLPAGKNPVLGVASIVMTVGLGWDVFAIERQLIPQVQGGVSFEIFKNLLSSNLEQSGGVFTILRFVFAVFAIFYFIIFAVSHLNGKASYKEYKLLALSPLCWAMCQLILKLMTAVSFISSSELLFEIFALVFAMLFLLTFARISTGVFTEDSMWGIYGYGFSAALFAGLVTVPRLVCAAVGVAPVENHEFNFAYLAFLLFVLSYIVASLGVGFKDGFKNIRTIAEVELPDDDEVVVKYAKSVVEPVEEAVEIFEAEEEPEEDVYEEPEEELPAEEEVIEFSEAEEEPEEDVYEEPEEELPAEEEAIEIPEAEEEPEEAVYEEPEEELPAEEEVIEIPEAEEEPEEVVYEEPEEELPAEEETAEIFEEIEKIEELAYEEPVEVDDTEESEDEAEDDAAVAVEDVQKPAVKATSKPKKEKKSLFGLRKAPVQDTEDIADDLKPISLADLKKKNQ